MVHWVNPETHEHNAAVIALTGVGPLDGDTNGCSLFVFDPRKPAPYQVTYAPMDNDTQALGTWHWQEYIAPR